MVVRSCRRFGWGRVSSLSLLAALSEESSS